MPHMLENTAGTAAGTNKDELHVSGAVVSLVWGGRLRGW
jgi:hypothetical protein